MGYIGQTPANTPLTGDQLLGLLTAKGDILVRTASTVTRQAIAGDGSIVMADASASSGIKWAGGVTARSSNTILAGSDCGSVISATSSFTQTLTAAATLGNKWVCYYRNSGTGLITIDPNSTETIDGQTTIVLGRNEGCYIVCDGSNFFTVGLARMALLSAQTASSSASLNFTNLTGFTKYIFELTNVVPATTATNLQARVSTDNGSSWISSGSYTNAWGRSYSSDGTNDEMNFGGSGTAMGIVGGTGVNNDANHGANGRITMDSTNPGQTHFTGLIGVYGGTNNRYSNQTGFTTVGTSNVNGVQFYFSSGNIASGTILCLGLRGY